MKIFNKIKDLIFKKLNIHVHEWRLHSTYTSNNKMYGHDHYICDSCKTHKHIKRNWKNEPIVKLVSHNHPIIKSNEK